MAAIGMRHVRTFHMEWDEPLSGSDLGEVEYAISQQQWFARPAHPADPTPPMDGPHTQLP
jgi:hypothetical protein